MTSTFSLRKTIDTSNDEPCWFVEETLESGKVRIACVIRKAVDFSGCSVAGYQTSLAGQRLRAAALTDLVSQVKAIRSA